MANGLHENFKIISNGRELPFPWTRIIAIAFFGIVAGYALALFDVAIELHKRFPLGVTCQ